MRWLQTSRLDKAELIDEFDHSQEAFESSFADLRRINRWLGGYQVIQKRLFPLLKAQSDTVTLLDVGTGSADIPIKLVQWARKHGVDLHITALDANEKVLEIARKQTASYPEITPLHGCAPVLDFEDNHFDFAISCLTFHHFAMPMAAQTLAEMARVARKGVLISDLRRGRLPAALIWLTTRATGMHSLTRHDGPLSVMRAYTVQEYRQMAQLANQKNVRVYKHPFWRAALLIEPEAEKVKP